MLPIIAEIADKMGPPSDCLPFGLFIGLLVFGAGMIRWWASLLPLPLALFLNYAMLNEFIFDPTFAPLVLAEMGEEYIAWSFVFLNFPIISAYFFVALFYFVRSVSGKRPAFFPIMQDKGEPAGSGSEKK